MASCSGNSTDSCSTTICHGHDRWLLGATLGAQVPTQDAQASLFGQKVTCSSVKLTGGQWSPGTPLSWQRQRGVVIGLVCPLVTSQGYLIPDSTVREVIMDVGTVSAKIFKNIFGALSQKPTVPGGVRTGEEPQRTRQRM